MEASPIQRIGPVDDGVKSGLPATFFAGRGHFRVRFDQVEPLLRPTERR
jgi:hypothetical protein